MYAGPQATLVGLHRQFLGQRAHEVEAAPADENQHELVAVLRDPVVQCGAFFVAAAEKGSIQISGEDGLRHAAARTTHRCGAR
jgi:hypothetical protein